MGERPALYRCRLWIFGRVRPVGGAPLFFLPLIF